MTTVIRTSALHKSYGKHPAVRDLNMEVTTGTIFGLIGPNGAGKTTALRMLVDIIRPTSGEISVLGANPRTAGAALRRRIGYLPGELRADARVTAGTFLRQLADISGPVRPGAIDAFAERLGLDLSRRVTSLSKGNKQKVGLVQAFMHHPDLLVLDEPTSGLDPLVQREFLAMVREARDAGQTVLLSSHILSEIQQTADNVIVLANGEVVANGPVESLRFASVRRIQATLAATDADRVRSALLAAGVQDADVADPTSEGLIRVAATARGDIDPVIRALATATIRDLTVEEPDLEESVLALYSSTEMPR